MDFADIRSTNHVMVASGVAHENATPQMDARMMPEHHSRPDISIVPFGSLLTDVCGLLELQKADEGHVLSVRRLEFHPLPCVHHGQPY
jgi:hypothetical protein